MENLNSIGSRQSGNKLQNSYDKQRIREVLGDYQSREWSTPAISNINYHALRSMHVRGDQNSIQTARQPLTEAQQDQPLKRNEPWTQVKRHAHAQSEMTRFVDDMMSADKFFRLY